MHPIDRQQRSTREKVYGAIGNTVGLGLDVSAFAINLGAYGVGKTVRTLGTATKAAVRGVTDKAFYHP